MNTNIDLKEAHELLDSDNVLPFAPIAKAAGLPPKDTEDWLGKMECGTLFLARPRNHSGFLLTEFTHGGQKGTAVLVVEHSLNTKQSNMFWTESSRFSKQFELFSILEYPDTTTSPEE